MKISTSNHKTHLRARNSCPPSWNSSFNLIVHNAVVSSADLTYLFRLTLIACSYDQSVERTSCELAYQMSAPDWQTAFPTGNLVATYRGIRIVIKLGEKPQSP